MTYADELEIYMLELINAERTSRGMNPLKLEINLNQSAEDHSEWMLANNVFSHTGVGGTSSMQRMVSAGFDLAGNARTAENIAIQSARGAAGYRDDVKNLHDALMNSPGHRANILNPDLKYIGIGVEIGSFTYNNGFTATSVIVTQNFGSTQGSVDLDDLMGGQNPLFTGTQSHDAFTGSAIDEEIKGMGGNDTLNGAAGHDEMFGGNGNDKVRGNSGKDTLWGENGDDFLFGDSGNDRLYGGAGRDNLYGNAGSDFLDGGDGNDVLRGHDGADTLTGKNGNDALFGGNQNDRLFGANGNDSINGGQGNDYIAGGNNNDVLLGAAGSDTLLGGSGNDRLDGGGGNDLLRGHAGSDTFIFGSSMGQDTIEGGFQIVEEVFGKNDSVSDTIRINNITNPDDVEIRIEGKDTIFEYGNGSVTIKNFTFGVNGWDYDVVNGGLEYHYDSVICTHMHRHGYIPDDVFAWDGFYGKHMLGETVLRGYHAWAKPFVRHVLEKSDRATRILAPAAQAWALEMAHRCDPEAHPKGSRFGRAILTFGVPVCLAIGWVITKPLCKTKDLGSDGTQTIG